MIIDAETLAEYALTGVYYRGVVILILAGLAGFQDELLRSAHTRNSAVTL